ncbi:MAG: GPW/gp25 family protein [Lachnospiraceae bacterium]|nr:GPW/gp25 family protein [Lachnospiraceae bacterium]
MADRAFLGKGMKFPPQVNLATGRFVVSSEEESVKESIYLILMTQKTERFIRPEFGCNLMDYAFMDINLTSVSMLERNLTDEILLQEPRVSDVEIMTDADTKPGCLIVNISYTIIGSNVRDNLVFPFYLDAVTEDEGEEEQYGQYGQHGAEEYEGYEQPEEQADVLG